VEVVVAMVVVVAAAAVVADTVAGLTSAADMAAVPTSLEADVIPAVARQLRIRPVAGPRSQAQPAAAVFALTAPLRITKLQITTPQAV
jgi:hypothetical protein